MKKLIIVAAVWVAGCAPIAECWQVPCRIERFEQPFAGLAPR